MQETDEAADYLVVVNAELQYSIWHARSALPSGWRSIGEPCSRRAALAYIDEHWTDMRPLSIRSGSTGHHEPA